MFAKKYTAIKDDTIKIIFNARKTLFFSDSNIWTKQSGGNLDVAMCSFDGQKSVNWYASSFLTNLPTSMEKKT